MIQVPVDSLAQAVAPTTPAYVAALASLGTSVVLKYAVDVGKKASVKFDEAPAPLKALAVVAFGQVATLASAKAGLVLQGGPSALDVTLSGLVVSASSMGVHALSKLWRTKK